MSLWASVTPTLTPTIFRIVLSVEVCGCHFGHQWASVTPILTPTIFGIVFCQWESVGVIVGLSGCQWVSVTPTLTPTIFRIVFCQWKSVGVIVGVSGRQWVSMWVSVGVSGCQWASVGVSGCVLVAPYISIQKEQVFSLFILITIFLRPTEHEKEKL